MKILYLYLRSTFIPYFVTFFHLIVRKQKHWKKSKETEISYLYLNVTRSHLTSTSSFTFSLFFIYRYSVLKDAEHFLPTMHWQCTCKPTHRVINVASTSFTCSHPLPKLVVLICNFFVPPRWHQVAIDVSLFFQTDILTIRMSWQCTCRRTDQGIPHAQFAARSGLLQQRMRWLMSSQDRAAAAEVRSYSRIWRVKIFFNTKSNAAAIPPLPRSEQWRCSSRRTRLHVGRALDFSGALFWHCAQQILYSRFISRTHIGTSPEFTLRMPIHSVCRPGRACVAESLHAIFLLIGVLLTNWRYEPFMM